MSNVTYVINTTSSNVVSGNAIPLTTIARRSRCSNINLINNALIFTAPGYYKIDGTVTFTSVAGTASIALQKDSVTVPGMTSSVTAEASTTYTLPISGIVRIYCGEQPATIVLENTGVDITVTNVSLTATYL